MTISNWRGRCKDSFETVFVGGGLLVIASYLVVAVMHWVASDETLVQILVTQWHWLVKLMHRVW